MLEFETSAAGLTFTCAECGEESFLANPSRPPEETADEPEGSQPEPETEGPGETVCPKCGHAQRGDDHACHKCGLMFERFDPEKLPPDPPEAAQIWKRILADPSDEDLHESFVRECLGANRLDYATKHYRFMARTPETAAIAEKMLGRVVLAGQSQIAPSAMSGTPRPSGSIGKIIMWLVVVAGLGLLLYYVISVSSWMER
jgi:hypothetical protein